MAPTLDGWPAAPIGRLGLEDKRKGGRKARLGVQVEGFPNMFMLMGPHIALGNIPRSIEYNVEWVTGITRHTREHGLTRAECRPEGVSDWTDHAQALGESLLSNEIDSWMTASTATSRARRSESWRDTRAARRRTGQGAMR